MSLLLSGRGLFCRCGGTHLESAIFDERVEMLSLRHRVSVTEDAWWRNLRRGWTKGRLGLDDVGGWLLTETIALGCFANRLRLLSLAASHLRLAGRGSFRTGMTWPSSHLLERESCWLSRFQSA